MSVHTSRWSPFLVGVVLLLLPCCRLLALQDPAFTPPQLLLALTGLVGSIGLTFLQAESKPGARLHPWFFLTALQLTWMLLSLRDTWLVSEGILDVLRFAIYAGWTILLARVLRMTQDPMRLLRRMALGTVLLCLIPFVVQLWELLAGPDGLLVSYRLSSFFGNKNYYSGVLVLLLPWTLAAARQDKGWWRLGGLVACLLVVAQLVLLQSVAAWIAMGFMAMVWALLQGRRLARGRLLRIAAMVAAILIAAVYLMSRFSNYDELLLRKVKDLRQDGSVSTRIAEASLRNENSLFERQLMFRNAWLQFLDHPVFGAGVSNWRLLQAQYGVGGTPHLNGGQVRFEHPHNEYLLLLAELGVPGLLCWLAALVALVLPAIRLWRERGQEEVRQAAQWGLLGVTGFMALSCFAYPALRPMERMLFQLHAALLIAITPYSVGTPLAWVPGRRAWWILSIVFLAGCGVLWKRLGSELHFFQALIWQSKRQPERMIREVRKASSDWMQVDNTTTPLIWYEGMAAFYRGEIPRALPYFQRAERLSPYHLRVVNDLGTCYERMGRLDSAVSMYERGLQITPHFVEGRLNLSAAWFNAGRSYRAASTLAKLDPGTLRKTEQEQFARYAGVILASIARSESAHAADTAKYFRWVETYPSWKNLLMETGGDSVRVRSAIRTAWSSNSEAQ